MEKVKELLEAAGYLSFILMVDEFTKDCKSIYTKDSDLDKEFELRRLKIKEKITQFSKKLHEQNF